MNTVKDGQARRSRLMSAVLCLAVVSQYAVSVGNARAADSIVGTASVIDAGTLKVDGKKIHLYGIEAPDADQVCLRDAKPWKCGAEAEQTLRRRVEGNTVKCQPVESGASANHVVARCEFGGDDLSELLVKEGWAVGSPTADKGEFADEQKEAKAARRGLWASESDNPEEIRRQRMN